MKQEWRVYSKRADFAAIGKRFNIDPVIARIIRNRDVCEMKDIDMYLNGTLADLHNPRLMKDMDKAVDIMTKAIADNLKIRIIGDYDIDGISSIYILFKGLTTLGADVDYDIPDRIVDGYGINENLIKKAYDDGRELIITCDNGIAAIDQIDYAKSLGMTVIVTDHHDVQYEEKDGARIYKVPHADAVVDPKQPDCSYPFKCLCGAGIAYKFICEMYDSHGVDPEFKKELLEMAAFATIGDIVDLLDENRIIVREGLKLIHKTRNIGLNYLIKVCKTEKSEIKAYHIGFILGPCMNASGRLDTAKRALKLLLTSDDDEAFALAADLKELNDERKKLTVDAVERAVEEIDNGPLKDDKILVVYLPECHESIAGIVAGRIREKYYKPTIVLTKSEDGVKGSARSTEQYNIFEGLMECKEYLTKFGGHPMAAGLSLAEENVEVLRKALNDNCRLTEEDMIEKIWIDVPMPLEYTSYELINQLQLIEPFGKANTKPVLADKNLRVAYVTPLGKEGKYTRLSLVKDNGFKIPAVGFFPPDELMMAEKTGRRISCIYNPEINTFRGNSTIQIQITSYRIED